MRLIHRFFESALPYLFRPKNVTQWSTDSFDNFKFIVQELFLYTIAILLRRERFGAVISLLSIDYYVGETEDAHNGAMRSYSMFRSHLQSLDRRNKRLNLRRVSLHADLLRDRCETSGLTLRAIMQADFVLYFYDAMRSLKTKSRQDWWPETLIWFEEYSSPFEIFARSESRSYFERICPMLAVESKEEIENALPSFGHQNARLYLPRWDWHSISIPRAINLEKLATKP